MAQCTATRVLGGRVFRCVKEEHGDPKKYTGVMSGVTQWVNQHVMRNVP